MKAAAALMRFAAVILITVILGSAQTGCGSGGTQSVRDNTETLHQQPEEWFYDSFDPVKKAAYDAFRIAAENPFDEEPVPIRNEEGETASISIKDLDEAYQGFLYDHPEVFWLSRTYRYRAAADSGQEEFADAVAVVPLSESEEDLNNRKKEFEIAASGFLQEIEDSDNDKDRAAAIYDKIASQTLYEGEALYDDSYESGHTAYSVVTGKRGVCDGIALAYKYLLSECGIRCIVIPGESEGTAHVWNTVYWDDSWHEADLTWDTASEENDSMQYFDLSTEEMNKDHSREKEGIALAIPRSSERSD